MEDGTATLIYDETRDPGVYRFREADGKITYFVAQADPRESDLTPCTAAERDKVKSLVPTIVYEDDRERLKALQLTGEDAQELWWLFWAGVVGLLCGEVWFTRRLALTRT